MLVIGILFLLLLLGVLLDHLVLLLGDRGGLEGGFDVFEILLDQEMGLLA